jgi:hypothetical protein
VDRLAQDVFITEGMVSFEEVAEEEEAEEKWLSLMRGTRCYKNLISLTLSGMRLGPRTSVTLNESLRRCALSLRFLSVKVVREDRGGHLLGDALLAAPQLTKLDLFLCVLNTTEAQEALAAALSRMGQLRSLILSEFDHFQGDSGRKAPLALDAALASLRQVEEVKLTIRLPDVGRIANALPAWTKLKSFSLDTVDVMSLRDLEPIAKAHRCK